MNMYANKTAVVTGAGGTLCSQISIHLAKEGANVVLAGRSAEKLDAVGDKIKAFGGEYMIRKCDVTSVKQVSELAEATISKYGRCDFLINGAGGNNIKAMTSDISYPPPSDASPGGRTFFDLETEDFEAVLRANTMGTVIPSKIFGKTMAESGGGNIINFASMNTYRPLTKVPAYAMSKAAVSNFTKWLAAYLAPSDIRVNAIAPGFFVNERSKAYLGTVEDGLTQRGKNVISHTPMGRFGQPSDLLGCVDFLLQDSMSSFVTGITIPVDGGFLSTPGI